jgi:hypothetical protein
MNVLPFRPPEIFERYGIDWTREPASDRERALREAFLTYETSCIPNGLTSLLLLAIVCRRRGAIAADLEAAAGFAEVSLGMTLQKHRDHALEAVHDYLATAAPCGPEGRHGSSISTRDDFYSARRSAAGDDTATARTSWRR